MAIAIVVFCVLLVQNIQSAKRAGVFNQRSSITEILLQNKKTHLTSLADIELIDTWMTFQYVNFIFDLPLSYLQKSLRIEESAYPKIPIGKYIKIHNLNRGEFLLEVKKLVREHMTANAIKS